MNEFSAPVRGVVLRLRAFLVAVVAMSVCVSARAATYYEEQGQLVRAGRSVTALGPDLFGNKVNHKKAPSGEFMALS